MRSVWVGREWRRFETNVVSFYVIDSCPDSFFNITVTSIYIEKDLISGGNLGIRLEPAGYIDSLVHYAN